MLQERHLYTTNAGPYTRIMVRWLRKRRTILYWCALVVISLVGFGLLSVALGQDANWDLKNYHYYNGYAFVHHRLDVDVAPAQLQTYYNPLLDVPFYLLVSTFSPRVTSFGLGAIHGLNFWFLFLIGVVVLPKRLTRQLRYILAGAAGLAGFLSPITLAEHGGTMNDNFISIFALCALWLLLLSTSTLAKRKKLALLGLSGLVMGFATGARLTIIPFAIGLFLAVLVSERTTVRSWLTRVAIWSSSAAGGFALANGFWMYRMWQLFANPVFPYFNGFFKSPYWSIKNLGGPGPGRVWQAVKLPFTLLEKAKPHKFQWPVRDARLSMLIVLLVVGLAVLIWALIKRKHITLHRGLVVLLVTFLGAYPFWFVEFNRYRYMQPLELLAPVIIFLLIELLTKKWSRRTALIAHGLAFVLIVGWVYSPSFGRVAFAEDFFDITPKFTDHKNVLVLITGKKPVGYLAAAFPESYRLVMTDGNMLHGYKSGEHFLSNKFVQEFIVPAAQQSYDRVLLLSDRSKTDASFRYESLGFERTSDPCISLSATTLHTRYDLCELQRVE